MVLGAEKLQRNGISASHGVGNLDRVFAFNRQKDRADQIMAFCVEQIDRKEEEMNKKKGYEKEFKSPARSRRIRM